MDQCSTGVAILQKLNAPQDIQRFPRGTRKAAQKGMQKGAQPRLKRYIIWTKIRAKLAPRAGKKCLEVRAARAVRSPADTKGAHGLWHTVPTKYCIFSLTGTTRLAHRLAKRCYFRHPLGPESPQGSTCVPVEWGIY